MLDEKRGFTIIELLVVISILAVLSMIGFFAYRQIFQGARDTKRQSDLKSIQSALEQYRADQFHYPDDVSEVTPGSAFSKDGKTYLKEIPKDPKNTLDYLYKPLSCDTGSKNCQNYCLFANLEVPRAGNSLPSGCSDPNYNFAVTKP